MIEEKFKPLPEKEYKWWSPCAEPYKHEKGEYRWIPNTTNITINAILRKLDMLEEEDD
jgi:hypothetical protein